MTGLDVGAGAALVVGMALVGRRGPGGPRGRPRSAPLGEGRGPRGDRSPKARRGPGAPRGLGEGGARWAKPRELAVLRGPAGAAGRITLGTTGRVRRRVLAAEEAQSVVVLGPTQSGKTSALAIPAIVGWDGPVVATSVKADLLDATARWRAGRGEVLCFDPAGSTGRPAAGWTPLVAARTWPGARRVARELTEVVRGAETTSDGEFWYATAAKLLAPLFFAASRAGATMADVVRWVDTQEVAEVAAILEGAGEPGALQAAQATWLREDRQRSAVYTTAETVLEPLAESLAGAPDPGAPTVDPDRLVAGSHTLYVCAPAHDQRRLRPLFTALIRQVLDAAFGAAARRGGRLARPLLVVLDEAANIAPLPDLDVLAATGAGQGIQLVTVFQDLSQVHARYGPRAATVVNNHRAKLFLPGISDPPTLELARQLVGDQERTLPSVTRGGPGGVTTTASPALRPLLAAAGLRRLAPGRALLVYGTLPPALVALRPFWEDPLVAGRVRGRRPRRPLRGR